MVVGSTVKPLPRGKQQARQREVMEQRTRLSETFSNILANVIAQEQFRTSGPSLDGQPAAGKREWVESERAAIEQDWERWLLTLFPVFFSNALGQVLPFGPHHCQLWQWVWQVRRGAAVAPFVALWPRGGGKSTSAELAAAAWAARGVRRYGLYVCRTQDQADDHLATLAGHLENATFTRAYPHVADRMLGRFGHPKGWRRNRLRTASGYTMDALGLEKGGARGLKIEEARPDHIIFDDIDNELDSPETVERLITILSRRVLPTATADAAILFVQNLVHHSGIAARLARVAGEPIDLLHDRIVSGPFPALRDVSESDYVQQPDGRWTILRGTPLWAGQDLEACQRFVDRYGYSAFRSECQHDDMAPAGGLFAHLQYRHCAPDQVPPLQETVCYVDPTVTNTDRSDNCGIQIDGRAEDGTIYRLFSWEGKAAPREVLRRALEQALHYRAGVLGVETDQGGDLWEDAYWEVVKELEAAQGVPDDQALPMFAQQKAGAGHGPKAQRAGRMLAEYERGRFVHVTGTSHVLEKALGRFPVKKPYDLTDAAYWSWWELDYGGPVGVRFF